MKPKYITKDNYRQFKPSEFIRSFASDIQVALDKGKPMDMSQYEVNFAVYGCLPCLGGMACMNMGLSPLKGKVGNLVANIGDNIRCGDLESASRDLGELYSKDINIEDTVGYSYMMGVIRGEKLISLQKRVHSFADQIEKAGY